MALLNADNLIQSLVSHGSLKGRVQFGELLSQAVPFKPFQLFKNSFLYGAAAIAKDLAPDQGIEFGKNAFFNGNCYFCMADDSDSFWYDKRPYSWADTVARRGV